MAKVSIVKCADYKREQVHEAVERSIDLVGGIEEFVKPGMKVLLKPNLLSPRPPEDCVDTHPEVVRALVRLVKDAKGTPIIGDSPGGYGNNVDEVFRISGMKNMAKEEGVDLVKFRASRFVDGIPISRYVFDCDCFISIPKLKTHCLTMMTAAVKNTFGTVTGLYKAECHSRAPKEDDFAKIIARIHSISRPRLNVLDGIAAMEGDGPSSGDVKEMGLVMASSDAVAMDSCIAKIVGLAPLDILTTREAYKLGLGEADLSRIEIIGDDISAFASKGFKLPQTMPLRLLPKKIAEGLASFVKFRPVIAKSRCRGCNLCKISCPVDAIESDGDYCKINYTRCVTCMCCHEVCPYTAIDIKRSVLAKLIWG